MGMSCAHDLVLSGPIEVVLLVCLFELYKEGGQIGILSWVVKIDTSTMKQHVIGTYLFKNSAAGFTR